MTEYSYTAADREGKIRKGTVTASDEGEVIEKLKRDNLTALEINRVSFLNRDISFSSAGKVSARSLAIFSRQMESMLKAGITVPDALTMLAAETDNRKFAKALGETNIDVKTGESLSVAMRERLYAFPELMVNMVAAGESTGKLDTAFNRVAAYYERKDKIGGQLKKALTYPLIVGITAVVIIIVMLMKVIPSYARVFDAMGAELPLITRVMLRLSEFIGRFWYIMASVLAVIILTRKIYGSTKKGKIARARAKLAAPITGKFFTKIEASSFARTLSSLMGSGIPMLKALHITAESMNNELYKEAIMKASEEVAKGVPLSEPLRRSGVFPPMVVHMIAIGESGGSLVDMLSKLADYCDEDVKITTETMMTVLEPIIILILAALVTLLIAAIIAPMLGMYSVMETL